MKKGISKVKRATRLPSTCNVNMNIMTFLLNVKQFSGVNGENGNADFIPDSY
jgi:hypothetical protein